MQQTELKELLDYDPVSGIFTWKQATASFICPGSQAGHQAKLGYINIGIHRKVYLAHRLAFLYMTGAFPVGPVDHLNGYTNDNRWENLRDASHEQNARNAARSKKNTSGVTGVIWNKRAGKWQVRIMLDRKSHSLGYFTDLGQATAVRKLAEQQHGFGPNHGSTRA